MRRPCFWLTTLALLVALPATGSAQVNPAPRATVENTVYLSDCAGEIVFAQGAANPAESSYKWQQIENGKVITLPYTSRNYPYTIREQADTLVCEVVSTTVNAKNNLMASGDFEVCPPDFESDYQYAFAWNEAIGCSFNQGNYYDDGVCPDSKYKSNIYAITANAHTFWRDYLVTKPHGGNYFALFDAGKEGCAWKAETKKGNPNLKVLKDSTYLFSYWAAHPNGARYSNSPAELQFVLILRNDTQKADTVDLGAPHKLYQSPEKDNEWHKVEVQWTNTLRDCDDVVIGVYDRNRDSGVGNDFCLDDIMFQNTTYVSTEVLYRTTFIITPKPAAECCPDVLRGNPVDTTVCRQDLPLVWHKTAYGETFDVRFDGVDASGNSTIDTVVRYKTQHIGCDSVRFQFRLHTQDCHTCPTTIQAEPIDTVVCYDTPFPLVWRGHTFAAPEGQGMSVERTTIASLSDPDCDSIVLTYRVRRTAEPTVDSASIVVCENELPYLWVYMPNAPINETGIYQYTITGEQGCDSILHILYLQVNPSVVQYKKWADVVFIPDSAERYTAYQWYHDAQPIAGATEQFYHAPAGLSGAYHCVMQTRAGTTEQSCPEDFGDIRRSADENPGQQPDRQIVARRTMWISPVFRVEITTYSDNTIQAEKQCVVQH